MGKRGPKPKIMPEQPYTASTKEQIDAEPTPKRRERIRGDKCWYVDESARWFLMNVRRPDAMNMILTSVTGWDALREKEFPVTVEFRIRTDGPLSRRLRPLKDRNP